VRAGPGNSEATAATARWVRATRIRSAAERGPDIHSNVPAALARAFSDRDCAATRATPARASASATGTCTSMTPVAFPSPASRGRRTGDETGRVAGSSSPAATRTARSPCPTAAR